MEGFGTARPLAVWCMPPVWSALQPRRRMAIILGLTLILSASFVLHAGLERTPLPPYSVFPDDEVRLSWRLLLPVDMGASATPPSPGTYHWFTTGLTPVKLIERYTGRDALFYGLNAALVVVSFACTWLMFRSAVFSFTVTICMAFGTQLHWVHVCSSVMAFNLFIMYLEVNLLCFFQVMRGGRRDWHAGFVISLVLLALNHEQWLDYAGFLMLSSVFLLGYAWRVQRNRIRPRAIFVLVSTVLVAVVYLAVRCSYGRQQYRAGDESEMVFTYSNSLLAAEDVFSNAITYVYMAVSNFFPPCLVSSNSLYYVGAEQIVAEQNGYHAAQSQLVVMHHVFYWYYLAGIVFAAFVYLLIRHARQAFKGRSLGHVYLTIGLLMVASGFAVHALVKYRPYLSVPVLTYKCTTGVCGVAFLLAYALMIARRRLPWPRFFYPTLVGFVWAVIGWGALTRPAYLSCLNQHVGMSAIPDPTRHLPWVKIPGSSPGRR